MGEQRAGLIWVRGCAGESRASGQDVETILTRWVDSHDWIPAKAGIQSSRGRAELPLTAYKINFDKS